MSESWNIATQFVSNCVLFVIAEISKPVANELVRRLVLLIKPQSPVNEISSIRDRNMFKWNNGSSDVQSSSSSGRDIGDKWKSIIGHIEDGPLLDDEDVPEEKFYESSPETNKYKSVDDTLLEVKPKWMCVSDESFLKMEEMVQSPIRTPLKRITENTKEVDTTNLILFSPLNTKKTNDIESSVTEYETCESGESRMTDTRKTEQQDCYSFVTCDSGESRVSDGKYTWEPKLTNTMADGETGSDTNTSKSSSNRKNDSAVSSQPSNGEESLKFNDTLEEMEHLLKYGMNYMTSSDNPSQDAKTIHSNTGGCFEKYCNDDGLDFNQMSDNLVVNSLYSSQSSSASVENIHLPKNNLQQYRELKEIDIKSPVSKKTTIKKLQKDSITNKENKFRLRSPRLMVTTESDTNNAKASSFMPPKKTPSKPRKFFYDTPPKSTPKSNLTPSNSTPQLYTPSNLTPSKYTNIMSPIQYYIKNSPVVPKIQNVSPMVNLWEKQSHRSASKGRAVGSPKENIVPLKEKAYQQPKTTKLIETVEQKRLPKNFKVNLMAESLPKPVVIKHQHRTGRTPLKENNSLKRQDTYTLTNRDSFANLDVVGGEVSVCIGKPAVRTHTLK